MERCSECGKPIAVGGEARCPECQHSPAGDPMNAPSGSDTPRPLEGRERGANLSVWLGMLLVLLVAFAVGLFVR